MLNFLGLKGIIPLIWRADSVIHSVVTCIVLQKFCILHFTSWPLFHFLNGHSHYLCGQHRALKCPHNDPLETVFQSDIIS